MVCQPGWVFLSPLVPQPTHNTIKPVQPYHCGKLCVSCPERCRLCPGLIVPAGLWGEIVKCRPSYSGLDCPDCNWSEGLCGADPSRLASGSLLIHLLLFRPQSALLVLVLPGGVLPTLSWSGLLWPLLSKSQSFACKRPKCQSYFPVILNLEIQYTVGPKYHFILFLHQTLLPNVQWFQNAFCILSWVTVGCCWRLRVFGNEN